MSDSGIRQARIGDTLHRFRAEGFVETVLAGLPATALCGETGLTRPSAAGRNFRCPWCAWADHSPI